MHMAALLLKKSVAGLGFKYGWLMNALETARMYDLHFFMPSSISILVCHTQENTPQNTIQQPTTMYGINKVTGELLCQYYFKIWCRHT